jgi:hypothetical protein
MTTAEALSLRNTYLASTGRLIAIYFEIIDKTGISFKKMSYVGARIKLKT